MASARSARLIDEEMQAASLSIASDARAALLPLLGGDRQASRNEIPQAGLIRTRQRSGRIGRRHRGYLKPRRWRSTALSTPCSPGRIPRAESQFAKARAGGTSAGHDPVRRRAPRRACCTRRGSRSTTGSRSIAAVGGLWLHFSRVPLVAGCAARLDIALRLARRDRRSSPRPTLQSRLQRRRWPRRSRSALLLAMAMGSAAGKYVTPQ